MNILINVSVLFDYFNDVANNLSARGHTLHAINYMRGNTYLSKSFCEVFSLHDQKSKVSALDEYCANVKFLKEMEELWGVSVGHLIYVDRHLRKLSPNVQLFIVESFFRFFISKKWDVLVAEGCDDFISVFFSCVARKTDIPFLYPVNARIGDRFGFSSNEMGDLMPQKNGGLGAIGSLEDFRSQLASPSHFSHGDMEPSWRLSPKIFKLIRLIRVWRAGAFHVPALSDIALESIKRYFRIASIFLSRLHQDGNIPSDAMIFPLQIYPEASTLVGCAYQHDQLEAVYLARAITPADMVLVVREHPHAVGRRSLSFYRQLARIPGVVIDYGSFDRRSLLTKCCGVITFNSTLGVEALLLGKPVISLVAGFFDGVPTVFHFDKRNAAKSILEARDYLQSWPDSPENCHSRALFDQLIHSSFSGSTPFHSLNDRATQVETIVDVILAQKT